MESNYEKVKRKLEKIIENNKKAIINPYAANLNANVSDLIKDLGENGPSIISRILEEESLLYDCYSIGKKKEGENVGKEGTDWDDKLQRWKGEKPEIVPGQSYQKAPDHCKNKALMCWWKGKEDKNKFTDNEKSCGLIGKHMRKRKKEIKEKDILQSVNIYHKRQERRSSPDTVTADIYTPANFEGGGRKKTRRRRRKKKSKRKKTRRRRKKKKTRRKKKKKRKKRSRKLRGGNYWKFNEDTKQYEYYTSNNFFGRSRIVKFNSLTDFTKYMCKNFNKNKKKYPGLIQHPRIFNKDPGLKIFKDRRKGADNSGINIYQYKCGNCSKIITYNDEERKAIQFSGWDYGKEEEQMKEDKKKQNLDKFNEYINEQRKRKQEQSINDGRGRSDSAHDFKYVEVSPSVYDNDELYEYNPKDDDW